MAFDLIQKLLAVRESSPGQSANLTEDEITRLCMATREVFLGEPMLLEIPAPIKICGDVHGQYPDLLRIFEYGGYPPSQNYLFLGDYVDRGRQSIEVMCLLLAYKLSYPRHFNLLRGNHECETLTKKYGFFEECKHRYRSGVKLWKTFINCFNCMPVAAIVEEKIFCCHGGLSPQLENLNQIRSIPRPTKIPHFGVLCDLLWADPDNIQGWGVNSRGLSFTFGPDIVHNFLSKHDLSLICRAHEAVQDGYLFFANRQLVTIFSAPNYCARFENAAGILNVDETLLCSFQVLHPAKNMRRVTRQSKAAGDSSV